MVTVTLTEILEKIRRIEELDGFEGQKIMPKIDEIYSLLFDMRTGYIIATGMKPDQSIELSDKIESLVEDHIVGEIGRACDALGLELHLQSSPEHGHRASISKWTRVSEDRWRPIFGVDGKGESIALAAAMAYWGALQELMNCE